MKVTCLMSTFCNVLQVNIIEIKTFMVLHAWNVSSKDIIIMDSLTKSFSYLIGRTRIVDYKKKLHTEIEGKVTCLMSIFRNVQQVNIRKDTFMVLQSEAEPED